MEGRACLGPLKTVKAMESEESEKLSQPRGARGDCVSWTSHDEILGQEEDVR